MNLGIIFEFVTLVSIVVVLAWYLVVCPDDLIRRRARGIVTCALLCVVATAIFFQRPVGAVSVPTLVSSIYSGGMEGVSPGPASNPSVMNLRGFTLNAGNLAILSFTWCSNNTAACNSNAANPPTLTSVVAGAETFTCPGSALVHQNSLDFIDSQTCYFPNLTGGEQLIVVTFNAATLAGFQWTLSEYKNVAASTPLDCSNAALVSTTTGGGGGAVTAGTCMSTQVGDLYYQYCQETSNGIGGNGPTTTAITPGTGVTMVHRDRGFLGSAGQEINPSSSSLGLTFNYQNIVEHVNCILVAFKASATPTGGTPTGMYLAKQQYTNLGGVGVTTTTADWDTIGNAVVVASTDFTQSINSGSDGQGAYTKIGTNTTTGTLVYGCNRTPGALSVSITMSTTTFYMLQDWVGAKSGSATGCLDQGVTCPSPSSLVGSGATKSCQHSEAISAMSATDIPDIVPSATGGFVLTVLTVSTGPICTNQTTANTCGSSNPATGPSGNTFLCTLYVGETDSNKFCSGDAYAIAPSAAGVQQTWAFNSGGANTDFQAVAISLLPDDRIIVPSSLTYAGQQVGLGSTHQAITISNVGSGTVVFTSIVVSGANVTDFSQSNNCGTTLLPGTFCTVTVYFSATAVGNRTANVVVTDNASGSPQSLPLNGTGYTGSIGVF